MVGSFASLEIGGWIVLFELGSLGYNGVYLLLFVFYFLVGFKSLARFEKLLEFALDKIGFSLWVEGDVAVKDGVVGELKKEECASVPVARLSGSGEEGF